MPRDGRVRVNDDDLESLREAKELMYGDNAVNIPDGKAIRELADFYVKDQGYHEEAEGE